MTIEESVPLSRFTTLGTGGPARWFARPESVDELAALRPGMRVGWAPELDDAARIVASWARPGDVVLTLGAGDVDSAAPLLLELLA